MDSTTTHTLKDSIAQPVEELAKQGKEKAGQLADQIREGMHATLTDQKSKIADTLGVVSEGLHQVCDKLRDQGNGSLTGYVHQSHESLDRLSGYLRDRQVDEIADDVHYYARRNPTMVVGALFALGFVAGRFFRSSAPSSSKALAPYARPSGYDIYSNQGGSRSFEENRSWR